ncbi:uncharacterized protein LOC135840539 isoform X2 [Planococcus citri]|uniref:uncharacterized protein LOC135840539 isoform X2 n=1 Tax=Planococcus citri TaxID=170843 RepID=UPI0031F90DA1
MDPRFQPVYFIKDAKKKSFSLATQELVKTRNHINVDEGKTLIITCPNRLAQPERFYEIDIFLLCGKDDEFSVTKGASKIPPKTPVNKYRCENETGFHFKKESNNNEAKKQCKSFGKTYQLHYIGIYANLTEKWLRKYTQEMFQAIMTRKITYEWFTLYSVCSAIPGMNPQYTYYTINGEQVRNRQMKATKFEDNDMRDPFKYASLQLFTFSDYNKEKIRRRMHDYHKGKLDSFFDVENHYFVPIAMVPEDAMSFSSWRYATHLTSNIVPIWKQVSCTWKNIENAVKKAAIQIGSTLDIYTGIFKKIRLPTSSKDRTNDTGTLVEFGERMQRTDVPAIFWKLIYHKEKNEAIIFILHNEPYRTDKPDRKKFCKSICKKYGWEIENDIVTLGDAYCCDPTEFFKKADNYEKFLKTFEFKKILKLPNSKIEIESD